MTATLGIHDVTHVTICEEQTGPTKWTQLAVESVDWEGRVTRFSVILYHHTSDIPIEWAGR